MFNWGKYSTVLGQKWANILQYVQNRCSIKTAFLIVLCHKLHKLQKLRDCKGI